jgi:hypothetical protein
MQSNECNADFSLLFIVLVGYQNLCRSSFPQDYDDKGPILDCVVWKDDKDTWRAAVDTTDLEEEGSSVGKLADFVPLTNFRRVVRLICLWSLLKTAGNTLCALLLQSL